MAREIEKEWVVNIEGVKDESTLKKKNKQNHQWQWYEKALHEPFITAVYNSRKGWYGKRKKIGFSCVMQGWRKKQKAQYLEHKSKLSQPIL